MDNGRLRWAIAIWSHMRRDPRHWWWRFCPKWREHLSASSATWNCSAMTQAIVGPTCGLTLVEGRGMESAGMTDEDNIAVSFNLNGIKIATRPPSTGCSARHPVNASMSPGYHLLSVVACLACVIVIIWGETWLFVNCLQPHPRLWQDLRRLFTPASYFAQPSIKWLMIWIHAWKWWTITGGKKYQ